MDIENQYNIGMTDALKTTSINAADSTEQMQNEIKKIISNKGSIFINWSGKAADKFSDAFSNLLHGINAQYQKLPNVIDFMRSTADNIKNADYFDSSSDSEHTIYKDLKSISFNQGQWGGYFTSPFGNKSFYLSSDFGYGDSHGSKPHTGIDIIATEWDNSKYEKYIYSVGDGEVVSIGIGYCDSWGNNIIIKYEDPDNPNEYIYVRYAHLHDNGIKVKVGDKVTSDTHIANMGSTGHSTGPHLHICVSKTDPTKSDSLYEDPFYYLFPDVQREYCETGIYSSSFMHMRPYKIQNEFFMTVFTPETGEIKKAN